ncbi:hypothetical protein LCGC14_2062360, partial [marine sediment metagenome]
MKILITTIQFDPTTKGGAYRSIKNLVDGLSSVENIKILTQGIKNKFLKFFNLDVYLSSLKIIRTILKFKPDIIITQLGIAFPTIIISKLMKIPIIHIIRDTSYFCPKFTDIIEYGKACSGLNNRKECFKCINYWRSLRVLIGNKKNGWEYSLKSAISNILYKIRYFICKFNLNLLKKTSVNVVASNLMKKNITNKISSNVKIINITPINKRLIDTFTLVSYVDGTVVGKEKRLIFVMPTDDASYKGLDFILKLIRFIPKDYHIFIIGGYIPSYKLSWDATKLWIMGYIYSNKLLNTFYYESTITLVPTFSTEAF